MADGVAVVVGLQSAHEPVAALVGDSVYAGNLPQNASLPAIGVKEISRVELETISGDESMTLVTARIQVTAFGRNYPEQKALLRATKLGSGTHTGTVAGVVVRSVRRDGVGPDLSDEAAGIFQQSRDFKVVYLEPNPA